MDYEQFKQIAKNNGAVYNTYGNTEPLYEGEGDYTYFYTSYLAYAEYTDTKAVCHQLIESKPMFDDLINFISFVAPNITAIRLNQLLMTVSEHKETLTSKYGGKDVLCVYFNSYISIQEVYDFFSNNIFINTNDKKFTST
jgi:hypothetical protein